MSKPPIASSETQLSAQKAALAAAPEPAVEPWGGPGSSAAWALGGYASMQVMRFVGNIILTALLVPEVFGLITLVVTILQGLSCVSDASIGPCIVQSRRGKDPQFLRTAWTLSVIRGALLWGLAAAIAAPMAAIYEEPSLLWLIPAVGGTFFIQGFGPTARATLSRDLQRARLVLLDAGCYAVSLTIMILWVKHDPGVRGLAAGTIISALLQVGLGHVFLPGQPAQFGWDWSAFRELVRFGRWLYVSTVFNFLADQSDKILVAKLFGLHTLGIYNLAVQLATIPVTLAAVVADAVTFPLFSRLHRSGEDMRRQFAGIYLTVGIPAALMAGGLFAAGPTAVACLYREQYAEAGAVLQLLAISLWFQTLQNFGQTVLIAVDHTGPVALANAMKLATLTVAVPLGWTLGGLPGLILGYVAGELAKCGVTTWSLGRQGLPALSSNLFLTGVAAGVALIAFEAGTLVGPNASPWLRLAVQAAAVLVPGAVAVLWMRPWQRCGERHMTPAASIAA